MAQGGHHRALEKVGVIDSVTEIRRFRKTFSYQKLDLAQLFRDRCQPETQRLYQKVKTVFKLPSKHARCGWKIMVRNELPGR